MDFLILMQTIIILIVIISIVLLLRFYRAIKMEKRIGRYSIYPIREDSSSLIELVEKKYNHLMNRLEKRFSNNERISKMGSRSSKYVIIGENISPVKYIFNKLIIGFCFSILVIFSLTIQGNVINIFGLVISFIVGYYIYDIYKIIDNKIKIRKIRDDMLRVVIIMNNAFKAGKSIIQAVEVVSMEMPNPISGEFEKIYQDMLFGLSADVVFDRFAKRVDIDEVRYISSSLTILNKTGGNIINIFNSIEKSLFDRKKLEEELKNATAASNLVVKVLIAVPFIFIMLIYVVSPNYFSPLFSSMLGYVLVGVMIIMFIIYVLILKKVMKVKV